jgi:hypothetical protein
MSLRLKYVLLVIAPLFGIFAVILALGLQAFEENTRETIARELARSAELHAARIEVLLRKNKKGQISIFSNISQS